MNETLNSLTYHYAISGDDFTRAGEASSDIKSKLKMMGVDNNIIRKVAISMYEGEINMVIHANGGDVTVEITDTMIKLLLTDRGPGIKDIDQAMEAGFSTAPEEVRALGFGAGMGLPNMKKYSDNMHIESTLDIGTTVTIYIHLQGDTL